MAIPARRRAVRRAVAGLLCAAVVATLAACDDGGATGADVEGLAILSGDVGDTRLTVHGTDGRPREVDAPEPATAWISGAPDGMLVATLADGRLATRTVTPTADGEWQIVSPSDGGGPIGSLLFGAASPDGSRVAALTLGAAGQFGVALTDPASGRSVVFPIEAEPILSSPAWLDGERVGVVVVDADVGGAISIADPETGSLTGGPGNVRALAVSADGAVVAWVSAADGRLYGSSAPVWLAGGDVAELPIDPPGGGVVPGAFALDRTGARIAVVWEDDAGEVSGITVQRRTADGWSPVARLDPPGGDPRAVVTWLR